MLIVGLGERNGVTDDDEVGVEPEPSCFESEIVYPFLAQMSMNFCAASVFVVERLELIWRWHVGKNTYSYRC